MATQRIRQTLKFFFIIIAIFFCCHDRLISQQLSNLQNASSWNASWISAPNDDGMGYGVFHFRKNFQMTTKPSSFIVHISADNRYKLYVNDSLVSLGPTRGDLYYWNYETVDLSPYIKQGKNTIAALVWNEAQYKPAAQVTLRTAFVLQGRTQAEEVLNTNDSWKCIRDMGHVPVPGYFFAASKGEMINMNQSISHNWSSIDFDDNAWSHAIKVADAKLKGMSWGGDWNLVPSTLPSREMKNQRIPVLRKAIGVNVPKDFPLKKVSVKVPAHSTVELLLDQKEETNAYVTLVYSRGKNAGISIGYAESLYEKGSNGQRKGNRDDVEGKEFVGRIDSIISNGQYGQSFTTLNFRTYRYIRLIVRTESDPLEIDDLYGTYTAYPFQRVSTFNSSDTEVNRMLDIGWRTARLNAWESYTDCPYYEQLQYIGDTRIQALVSYYNSSDDRLARNAITQMDHSRLAEGITRSCYPSNGTQIISTFSLWYVCMLHDYWMYRNDESFVREKLMGVRSVLDFFAQYELSDGSIKEMPYWAFVDWSGNLAGQVKGSDGCAAIYDLQLLWAYQCAEQMESKLGLHDFAEKYKSKVERLKATIQSKYWDGGRKMYADTKEKNGFSQHVNSLAILTGVAKKSDQLQICHNMLSDTTLTQCSIYFKYYLHQALAKAGLGNDYMKWLDIWRENIKMGLTTWAEYSNLEYSRSDCHAWGSSPNIEFFRTVLGIDSDAPGFQKVRIAPCLGTLDNVSGSIPHPNGKIFVQYRKKGNSWNALIQLPKTIYGNFIWNGKEYLLKPGSNNFVL